MSKSFVDRSRLAAMLLAGEKVAQVAATLGCSEGTVSNICRDLGLGHLWVTAEERRHLAEIRAGRALVVPADSVPAAIRLAHRMEAALSEFRSALPTSSAPST